LWGVIAFIGLLREKGKVEEAARRGGERGGARSGEQRKERGAGKDKTQEGGADRWGPGVIDRGKRKEERETRAAADER
jgi:hypothetical protein